MKSRHKSMENGEWVNWQQKMVHSLQNEFWETVEAEDGGHFGSLFSE
jgi:hypothetical protein